MATDGDVVWAPDPFKAASGNPRPWLVIASESLPYTGQESIAVAFTTQTHHPGSFAVPGDEWLSGEPGQQSYALPWTLATLKDGLHVVGIQGSLTSDFTQRVREAAISSISEE